MTMPTITLSDGNKKQFTTPISIHELAKEISPTLAKKAIAGKVDGRLVDTSYQIEKDANVLIITEQDAEGLEVIRHSTAHLLAHAVKSLFPSAQVTIGPVIEDGFYYDFVYPKGFSEDDLKSIEMKMHELAKQNDTVVRSTMDRQEAIQFFRKIGEEYKAKIIEEIPTTEEITLYQQGNFIDLCRGPHVPRTGILSAFKLTKVSGAYWRGDSRNEVLQRIYGTAWADQKALDAYLHRLEEAEKRDHRKLAKKMDLFHVQEEAPGMVFWHANGWQIYQVIEQYLRNKFRQYDYQEVHTPQLVDLKLWKESGHWEKFGEEMFVTESESRSYAIKPMNCPCHVQIFKQGIRSYRDLPLRIAEFGSCHRNEPSGTLHGLMRVRNFVQDDGHIFCTEDQIGSEISLFIRQLQEVYQTFGFHEVKIKLSTRPERRVGSDALWDKAEKALQDVLNASQLSWQLAPGDGAFYGPKIEFTFQDCLGRSWTCGTVQVDFAIPDRLQAHYIAEDGSKQTPVMLHRAIVGSLERFIGILLEEYAGHLPLWLAPVQAVIMNITDEQQEYVKEVAEALKNQGIRVKADLRNEKISFKIREHTLQKVPYQLIVGEKERESHTITVRAHTGEQVGTLSLPELINKLSVKVA